VCYRAGRYCAVKTGMPSELDIQEPERVGDSVVLRGLNHVVITAVERVDLKDGRVAVFAKTVRAVRSKNPFTAIEVL
ncbi:lipoyl synthase, partial [Bacillus paranthracis]|nr:lipoyl synthase [Bacillus paranthracis]